MSPADERTATRQTLSDTIIRTGKMEAEAIGHAKDNAFERIRGSLERRKAELRAARTSRLRFVSKEDEIGHFAPRTWQFWRALITSFFVFAIVGHWLEIPYCTFMNECFGIVGEDYPVWSDPWYHPYWIYGIGAVIITLLVEPVKEWITLKRKTLFGAILQTFVMVTIIAMLTELIMGWLVNQPDATGQYPFWDNSQLPLNVFGQAWLVNDMVIGSLAVVYVWVLWPLLCKGYQKLRPSVANKAFAGVVIGFAACCTASYIQLAVGA